MAISPALTAPEDAALSGVSTLTRYLSPVPQVTIATSRINQASYSYPLVQLTVDSTSGWSDVRAGMTVLIGSTAGASDIGRYRVRLTPGPTTLYIGETSEQDVGLLPIPIKTAGFADNQYITVVQDWSLWSILPVIDPVTGAIYEDYSLSVGTNNTTPPPLVNVVVNNRRNHLATLIPDSTTYALSAVATPTSWPTSTGESFTYLWTVPPEFTNVAGDTTSTLTADVPPGNYAVPLTVTGDGSGATQRIVLVHVHDTTDNPPLLISEMPRSDTRDRTGRRMSFDLYNNRLEDIPDGAACLYFEMPTWANQWVDSGGVTAEALDAIETAVDVDDGSLFATDDILLVNSEQMFVVSIAVNTLTVTRAYNGTTAADHLTAAPIYVYAPATDVPTATRQMMGWVARQDKSAEAGLRQATIELVSPSFLLSQLNSTSQLVTAVASPANWQEVKAALSTSSFMAWYMLKWRCANVLTLFNYTPFSVAASGQRLPSWTVDKGTVLQQVQLLATERGNFGCDSEGEFYFLRNPQLVAYADRSAVVVRDSVDASLYASASNPRELTNRVQQVRGEAFSWDGSAVLPTPYYSDAPKVPAQGTSQIKLPAQVVTGQSELNQLTGDRYAQANNPYPNVSYTVKKNRDVIEPAMMEFVEVTIPANLSASGVEYQANIVPLSVSKAHNADGTSDITVTGEGETHNVPGDTKPVPVGNDSLYSPEYTPFPIDPLPLPSLGDFNSVIVPTSVPSPQGATVSPGKGALWVSADGLTVNRTLDITVEPPVVDDVTPTDAFFTTFVMVVHAKTPNFSRGAYALGNDGTDSKVAYTTDVYADTVVWSAGDTLTGLYSQIESAGMASLAGGVVVYNGSDGEWEVIFDFEVEDGGFVRNPDPLTADGEYGNWVLTQGWLTDDALATGNYRRGCDIVLTGFSSTHFTLFEATYDYTGIPFVPPGSPAFVAQIGGSLLWVINDTAMPSGTGLTEAWTGDITGASFRISLNTSVDNVAAVYGGSAVLKSLRVRGVGPNPFGGGGTNVIVATSTDYGATFATESVGDSTGAAFCLSRFGVVTLAAVDGELQKATEFGGTFGSVTGGTTAGTFPLACRIPWNQWGSSSLTNNGTSPDFILAAAALVSGEALWKVHAGSRTAITPSVTGTKAIGVSSNCIGTWKGKQIVYIGDVSGAVYVFTTKNTGTTWTNVAISGANSVRAQRFDGSGQRWILATATDIRISTNGGTSWTSRTVSGGAVYAELMG